MMVTVFAYKLTGARNKTEVLLGQQNGLETEHWVVVGGRPSSNWHVLVRLVDENSLQQIKAVSMCPLLGFERERDVYPAEKQGKSQSIMTAVLQINLHYSRLVTAIICQKILADDIGVALIQEPWTVGGKIMGMSSAKGEIIYYDTVCNNHRACIYVRRKIEALIVN